ncbi:MAG: hypothetical protein GY707_15820 [Desulfobacteraceae bacterium]|nr:hypothetical protein [Desulfobacteraceae bacterium]
MKFNLLNMRKTTLKVLIVTLCLTILIFIVSFFYYGNINSTEDPRKLQAKTLMLEYDKKLEENQTGLALSLLNTIKEIYDSIPGYKDSYEVGVVFNNIASVYLVKIETEILTKKEKTDRKEMNDNLITAKEFIYKSINLYEQWIKDTGKLSSEEIKGRILPSFPANDPAFADVELEKIINKRVKEILLAQIETPRRLSVAYANLGVINRYQGNLDKSKQNYEMAINIWDKNYTAIDNLNILMNKPPQKRSVINKLFPPDKENVSEL